MSDNDSSAVSRPKKDRPWLMRTYAGHSSAVESNKLFRNNLSKGQTGLSAVSYTHLRAHETVLDLVCRLLLEKKKTHENKLHLHTNKT